MPARLGHLRLDVNDLDRMTAFYTTVLGLQVHERASDDTSHYAFLTDAEGMHHRLVLRQALNPDGRDLGDATRLDHFAWEIETPRALLNVVERLEAMGVETDLQEAGIAWQCYFRDPEGMRLEVYLDRRSAPDGRPFWNGIQEDLARSRLEAAANG